MSHGALDDNRRILIIDDNADIHADYRHVLSDHHVADPLAAAEAALFGDAPAADAGSPAFEICHASQGEDGDDLLRREMLQERPFALAFVDMRMPPGWDGLETIKRLWQADARLQVVLCTAYSDYSWFEICEALSPGDRLLILKKPFDAIEVRQLAASLVTKWNLSRAADLTQRELERAVEQRTLQLQAAKEAADQASRSKSEFLANISHEIRTPLTAILGFTKLLMDGAEETAERTEYLQIIRASAEHQLVLINDLLDVSKIEAGQMQIHRVACSARAIVDEVLHTLRYRADEKGLMLRSVWPDTVAEPIYTDPSRLRQLLINLINNAIKFTAAGSVQVVTRTVILEGRRRLQIDVIDTGMGIAEDKQQAIFAPFVQADSSIAAQYGGTGLGLAISRSIAGLLGGTLSLSSQVGAGSTFTLLIDAERTETSDSSSGQLSDGNTEIGTANVGALRGRRILLVEDNPFNRKLIRLTLSKVGAVVDLAENGVDGMERANATSFDLVLMDMQMPVMDGYAATAQFRKRGYTGPIIALTAHALPAERERCLAVGCNAFVSKPIDLDHLKAVIAQFLSSTTATPGKFSSAAFGQSEPTIETDDSAEFREVVCEFVQSLPDEVVQLRQALQERAYDRLSAAAHTLKGTGGTMGFPEVTDMAQRLESASKRQADAAIVAAIDELAAFVEGLSVCQPK